MRVTVILAAILFVGGLLPAAAAPELSSAHRTRPDVDNAPLPDEPGLDSFQGGGPICRTDASGDVEDRETGITGSDPQTADLTRWCVDYGDDGVAFALTTATPIAAGFAQADGTHALALDTDADDYDLNVHTDAGTTFGTVFERKNSTVACHVDAEVVEGYIEALVPAECIGTPQRVDVGAFVFKREDGRWMYDEDPARPGLLAVARHSGPTLGRNGTPVGSSGEPTAPPPTSPSDPPIVATDGNPATTDRLNVGTPVAGAVTISQARFGHQGAARVVLATSAGFADALAASPLLDDAPLLLTPGDRLPAEVEAEISRVLPAGGEVLVLGGEAAITPAVEQVVSARGFTTQRVQGPDRIATSIAVAEFVAGRTGAGSRVAIARAYGDGTAGWADSVTGGGWTAQSGTPLVITGSTGLDPRVSALLANLGTQETVVFGGTAAIGDDVMAGLPNPRRIAGPERASTAAAIASQLWGNSTGYIVLNGYRDDGWAYGLAGAGLASDLQMPLLVADTGSVPNATLAKVGVGCETGPPGLETLLLGDASVLSSQVTALIDAQDGGSCPTPPITIRADGLGVVDLGASAQDTVAVLTDALGEPTYVSPEYFPFCEPGAVGRGRAYEWGNLTLFLIDPDEDMFGNPGTGRQVFWGGYYGGFDYDPGTDTFTPRPDPHGFMTERGIGLGSTGAEIQAAYGAQAEFHPGYDDGYPPPIWDFGDGLYAFADTNDPQTNRIESFNFGGGCGE